jgi:hypothetical protein
VVENAVIINPAKSKAVCFIRSSILHLSIFTHLFLILIQSLLLFLTLSQIYDAHPFQFLFNSDYPVVFPAFLLPLYVP